MKIFEILSEGYLSIPNSQYSKKPPTKKHRAGIWENMLGTVFAMNDRGEVRYFDYDYDAAKDFADIKHKNDIRLSKTPSKYQYIYGQGPADRIKQKKLVLWVEKDPNLQRNQYAYFVRRRW